LAVANDTSVSVRDVIEYNRSYFWRVRAGDSAGFKDVSYSLSAVTGD
jgi:hypothetical protein